MKINYYKLLKGHGQVICSECDKVILQCKCPHNHTNIVKSICEKCIEKKEECKE